MTAPYAVIEWFQSSKPPTPWVWSTHDTAQQAVYYADKYNRLTDNVHEAVHIDRSAKPWIITPVS